MMKNKRKQNFYLKDFFFSFLCYSELIHSPNHTKSLQTTFRAFLAFVGDILLTKLKKQIVIGFVEYRLKNLSFYSVRRDIADLSSAFNWGISKEYLNENFTHGIKKPRIPEKLPVFFSENDFQLLIQNTEDEDLRHVFEFAVNTGLRQSELINLEWRQINFKDRLFILDNQQHLTKSKKIRAIPLNLKTLQILSDREQKKGDSDDAKKYVLTYQGKKIKQCFISHKIKEIIRKAGLNEKLKFHSLRSTTASWLVQRGVPLYQVSKLLGHSDSRVTQIYAHLLVDDIRDSVELLGNSSDGTNKTSEEDDKSLINKVNKILGNDINEY